MQACVMQAEACKTIRHQSAILGRGQPALRATAEFNALHHKANALTCMSDWNTRLQRLPGSTTAI